MKTKELIRLLQEEDPSGEVECCIGNEDIHYVSTMPAYWDGRLQILTRDKFYNITGGKVTSRGNKIKIHPLSIEDAIYNHVERARKCDRIRGSKFPVDLSELGNEEYKKEWKAKIEQWHDEIEKIIDEVDEWAKDRNK